MNSSILNRIIERVKSGPVMRVVLPEGEDPRVQAAAVRLAAEGLASPILLGDPAGIRKTAESEGFNLSSVTVRETQEPDLERYSEDFIKIRAAQGKAVSAAVAKKMVANPLFIGALMVKGGEADTMVAGAVQTTANVVRAALSVIGVTPGKRTLNSSFLMLTPQTHIGVEGAVFFADSGVNPDPSAEQLADIAESTAELVEILLETEPRVAFLAFSTHGSANHALLDKVKEAVRICREQYPGLKCDGELQADAALIPDIAARKCPDSNLKGQANALIFPDLNAGNICYKLVERLSGGKALGPLLQNTAIPLSDLSRGCDAEDIYLVSAITILRAQKLRQEQSHKK